MRDDDFFWEGVRDGKLLIQKCDGCQKLRHPPAPMCAHCQSVDWSPLECSGKGEVLGWVLSKHPTRDDPDVRTVVVVALQEGVRLISNLQGMDIDAIRCGQPVEVFFQAFDDVALPQFRPVGAARS